MQEGYLVESHVTPKSTKFTKLNHVPPAFSKPKKLFSKVIQWLYPNISWVKSPFLLGSSPFFTQFHLHFPVFHLMPPGRPLVPRRQRRPAGLPLAVLQRVPGCRAQESSGCGAGQRAALRCAMAATVWRAWGMTMGGNRRVLRV